MAVGGRPRRSRSDGDRGGDFGVVGVEGRPGRAGRSLPSAGEHLSDLLAELVSRGAVQEEVGRVVDVHEQLGHRAGQLELHGLAQRTLVLPEGPDDERHVHGQRGDQEGEGHGQQHDGQLRAFPRSARPPARAPASGGRGGVVAGPEARGVVKVMVVLGRVLHLLALVVRFHHVTDDEDVEDEDDDEGDEGVDAGVHPGPHLVDEVLVARRRLAVGHVPAVHVALHDLHGPEEVQVEGEHEQHQEGDHLLGAPRADHGRRLQREADDDVALHRDGDDEPDGQVAGRVAEGDGQLAQPVRAFVDVVACHLSDR